MSTLRISDAPLLPNVDGTEKIPTGGRGDYAVSIDQIKNFTQGGVPQQIEDHINDTSNPHQVTKDQVGLGNVDNTSDVDKPISTATQEALDLKANQSTTYTKTEVDESFSLKADKSYVDSQDLLKADQTYVDTALSNLSTQASKFYPTLVEANADIANIAVNQAVNVGEVDNGGLWYKATAEATTLTKSPYDPLTLAKSDATEKANTAEISAKELSKNIEKYGYGDTANLFSIAEIKGDDFSRVTTSAGRLSLNKVSSGIKITAPASSTIEVRYRFNASLFKNAGFISASALVKSVTESAGAATQSARLMVYQTTSTGSSLSIHSELITGASALTASKTFTIQAIALNPSAVFIEVGFSLQAVVARELIFEDIYLSASTFSTFTQPLINKNNIFIDAMLVAENASAFTGGVITENSNQVLDLSGAPLKQALYQVPAVGRFAPNSLIRLSADVYADAANASHATLIFYNAMNSEIGRATQASRLSGVYDIIAAEAVVPTDCTRVDIRLMKDGNATVAKFRNIFLSSSNDDKSNFIPQFPLATIYVDAKNGSDLNFGTRNAQLKTLTKAMSIASFNTRIILSEGDYYEAPTLSSKIGSLEILAARNSRVRLIGGTKLSTFTQTPTYTKVWQTPLAVNPVTEATDRAGRWLYQLNVADENTLITKRWKQQIGRTYRNEDCTQIHRVDSVAEIESALKPSWFWSEGTLYLSCAGFGNPNGQDIRIPETLTSPFYGLGITKNQVLKVSGVDSFFWLSGFRAWDLAHAEFTVCKGIGNRVNGFETSDSNYVKMTGCEAYGNWIDGCGGHVYRENLTKKSCVYDGSDNYFHDNGDDGFSYHEMWAGSTTGMLCEYNGDRGIADAVGAHFSHYNPIVYKNGQGQGLWTIDDGAGIACVGTSVDGGVSTDTTVFNPYAEGNLVNFNMGGSNDNVMNLFNPKSIDPVTSHYSASAGNMNLYDAGYSGSGIIKNETSTGNINVISTLPVPL